MTTEAILLKAMDLIDQLDLTSTIDRLVMIEKWSREEALEAAQQYRNYLFLRRKYPELDLPPSKEIDDFWHAHILHTHEYRRFCDQLFADQPDTYLDHHPHLVPESATQTDLSAKFEMTQDLYRKEFGEYIYQIRGKSMLRKSLDKISGNLALRFPKFAQTLKD